MRPVSRRTGRRLDLAKIGRNDPCPCGSGKNIRSVAYPSRDPFCSRRPALGTHALARFGPIPVTSSAAARLLDEVEHRLAERAHQLLG